MPLAGTQAFFPTLRRQTSYSAHHTSLNLSRRLRLLTITAWWLPRQHFPEMVRNLPVIHQILSLRHPALPELCSYYPQCLMVSISSVCTHRGSCASDTHTHPNRFAVVQSHHRKGFTNVMKTNRIEFKRKVESKHRLNWMQNNLKQERLKEVVSSFCITGLHCPLQAEMGKSEKSGAS